GDVREPRPGAVREANREEADAPRLPESELDARVLRGEVAAPGVHLTHDPAALREDRRDDRAGRELRERDLEPVSVSAVVAKEGERTADRVDGDVRRSVVVEVRDGQAATVHARSRARSTLQVSDISEPRPCSAARHVLEDLEAPGVAGEVRHRN